MSVTHGVRIDKWLWAARLYKTRALAAAACRAGHVEIAGARVKPAREVHVGEIVRSRHGEITRTTRVAGLIESRVSAVLARQFAADLTPASEHEKRAAPDSKPVALRPKGSGRPTKKDRRVMERVLLERE